MSELKFNVKGRNSVSPQMALLHLRWQQIRSELLCELLQETLQQSTPFNAKSAASAAPEKVCAAA